MKKCFFYILLILFSLNLFAEEPGGYFFGSGEYYIMDTNINVRNSPSLEGAKIGKVNLGDKITVIETEKNLVQIDNFFGYWVKIKYNNSYGYIFSKYIAVKTYPILRNSKEKIFVRFSSTSHHFYNCNLENDFYYSNGKEIYNIKFDKQYFDKNYAQWEPVIEYKKEFNENIILITIDNSYANGYGYRLFYVLEDEGKTIYIDKIKIGLNKYSETSSETTLLENNNFKIVTKGEGTSKTESFKLDFENGKYSIRKED